MSAPAGLVRAKAVIEALAGHSFSGLRNQQVANAIHTSASTTFRTLEALEAMGWAERHPANPDCWRLSPRLMQIALAHHAELSRLTQSVDDFVQRYSRLPN